MNFGRINDVSDLKIKGSGDYLSSLHGFASLLGSMEEAEKAANEMLAETGKGVLAPDAPKTEAEKKPDTPDLNELLGQLDALIGLTKIKQNVRSLINLVKVRKLREEHGLSVPPMSLHMVFMGNPGTGKTTVARLLAGLYCAIGVLPKGQLVEVDRAGLVAGFVGQTAMKTSEVIQKAVGGVLFIDEAYSLISRDGSNDFGHEAVETLLKAMEDHRDDLIALVAGNGDLMEEFISSNPGLESRFNRYFVFEDYTGDELYAIFASLCSKNQYVLVSEAENYVKKHFCDMFQQRDENFGNGRDVRNFFENMVAVHSDRVSAIDAPAKEDLMNVLPEDLEKAAVM